MDVTSPKTDSLEQSAFFNQQFKPILNQDVLLSFLIKCVQT